MTDQVPERQDEKEKQELEKEYLKSVMLAFSNYRKHSTSILLQKLKSAKKLLFSNAPEDKSQSTMDVTIFKIVMERLKSHLSLINMNAHFFYSIIENQPLFMDPFDRSLLDTDGKPINVADQEKVKSTLKQFVRDWSEEGKQERDTTYNPILNELESIYQNVPFEERGKIKVLVPGAGLGRLVYEVMTRGFSCQGNEFSFFMLLASNYILNQVKERLSIPIYPWIHQHCNMPSARVQTAEVRIPDVLVAENVPPTADFSMVAGDFIEVYSEPHQAEAWDVILTCFFIDTNKNFLKYLQVISKALKKGGTWINFGPLLYHFEGQENTIEFTLEEIKSLVLRYGFQIEKEEKYDTVYAACPDTMMHYLYRNSFFVATKLNK